MANSVTLLQLRTGARLLANERPSGSAVFITDTELTTIANSRCREFYDYLLAMHGDERFEAETNPTPSATVSGTATYALPTTTYRLLSVHLRWAANRNEPVHKLTNVDDRERLYDDATWSEDAPKAYRLRGTLLEFFPTPTTAVTVVLRHVPTFTDLSLDADAIDDINGWARLVMLGMAIDVRNINSEPASFLQEQFDRTLERVETLAGEREPNEPARIRDVNPEGTGSRWWWGPPS